MSPTSQKRGSAAAKPHRDVVDQRVLKAIGHPLRHRLLLAYNAGVASPNQLANRLEEPLGNVAYHTRILVDLDAIELVDTAQRRGATEHFYRATMLPFFNDAEWARLPLTTRRSIFAQDFQILVDDAVDALEGGGFDRPDAHVSRALLDLDHEGYDDVVGLLGDTLDRLLEIQAESAGRRVASDDPEAEVFSTEVGMLHFDRVPPRKARRKRSS